VKAHRELADGLDDVEGVLALMGMHRVAEDAPEQPDVLDQRLILLGEARTSPRWRRRANLCGLAVVGHEVRAIVAAGPSRCEASIAC